MTRSRKSAPCRLDSQGRCRSGANCKFSHDSGVQHAGRNARSGPIPSHSPQLNSPSQDTSETRPRPKRHNGKSPCRAWKAGTCTKGANCRFSHDVDKPSVESHGSPRRSLSAISRPVTLEEESSSAPDPLRAENKLRQALRVWAQEAEAAAARERAKTIREEAAKTITHVIFGSIVTYSAGLDVSNLVTGLETCTLRIGNLPFDVKEDDIHTLLKKQGLDANQFHLIIKKKQGRKPEAHIVTDISSEQALAWVLDGIEFQEEMLDVDMYATNSLEGMSAATGQGSDILTISWRAPSARYVAEYIDTDAARAKVKELDRSMYGGRRLKVEMDTQPRGRSVSNFPHSAIKINNLPPSVTDADVLRFTGSIGVRRLRIGSAFGVTYTVEEVARLIWDDVRRAVPGLKKFDYPPSTCTMEGIVSSRAHFSSWDEAHAARTCLSDKRYGNQSVWLRLPDPMHFTLVISAEQYKAQKVQWNSLSSSIKDRKACALNVHDSGNVAVVKLSGSAKEATGALKVRVENLARGDRMEGWHWSLGTSGNAFISRVHSETGAFVRADRKRQFLKVYGTPKAVEQTREMIKGELDRLSSLDYTVTLARNSVGFFIREGLQQLKDTLGEENVRLITSSRKITVSGGEEARHALDRLITLSQKGGLGLLNVSQDGQACPICYDDVSSPYQLGCGHTYCVACLRDFISSALESDQLPLTCLGDGARCRVPVTIPTIQHFLPLASFNQLLEAAFDAYISKHPEEFQHCKTPDCMQIYRTARDGTQTQTIHCPSCFSAVCNGCHEDGHDGLSCAESKVRRNPAEQDRLNDAWIASQNGRVKKCPQCSVPIEKLEGCNHMTCRCGAHICWWCMGIFTAGTIYPHMHDAHGGADDDPLDLDIPGPPAHIGFEVNGEGQQELLLDAEARRTAALQNAHPTRYQDHAVDLDVFDPGYIFDPDDFDVPYELWERAPEEAERLEHLAGLQRQREAQQERRLREQREHQEAAERERRLREQRQLQEAEERERRLREQREHQQAAERERRLREQRQLQEAEEQERHLREQREHQRAAEQERRLREQRQLREAEERERRLREQRQLQQAEEQERCRRERHRLREEWERRLTEQRRQLQEAERQGWFEEQHVRDVERGYEEPEQRNGGGWCCMIILFIVTWWMFW